MEAVLDAWKEEETEADESDVHFVQDEDVLGFQDDHIGSIAAVEVHAVLQREIQAIFQEMQIRVFNYVEEKLQEHRAIWRLELTEEVRRQLARTSYVLKNSTDGCNELQQHSELPSLQRCGIDEASHCQMCLPKVLHGVAEKSLATEQAQELSNCCADLMQHAECSAVPEQQSRGASKATLAVDSSTNIPVQDSVGRLEDGSVGVATAVRSDPLVQELQRLEGIIGGLFSPQHGSKGSLQQPNAQQPLHAPSESEAPHSHPSRGSARWAGSTDTALANILARRRIISEGIPQERKPVDTSSNPRDTSSSPRGAPSCQPSEAERGHFVQFWGAKQSSVADCVAVELGLADDMLHGAIFPGAR